MAYSGPASFGVLEDDLAVSEDDEIWPRLPDVGRKRQLMTSSKAVPPLQPPAAVAEPLATTSSSKRGREDLTSSDENIAPVNKTCRAGNSEGEDNDQTASKLQPTDVLSRPPPPPAQVSNLRLPAFAPRTDYLRLEFEEVISVETKLRWLSEVSRQFCLEKNLAEVKMSAVTSRFVYVARARSDVIKSAVNGEILAIKFKVDDYQERPKKLKTFLITRYPVGVDPNLSKELPGVYSCRRFYQQGRTLSRIIVTWNKEEPPPSTVEFSFLPCLPPCEVRPWVDETPTCFKCWGSGHISTYCKAAEKCGWCSGNHDSRTCQHRGPPRRQTEVDNAPPTPPPAVAANWQCPRCNERGVSAWHGCSKRPTSTSTSTSTPSRPPPPPSAPPSPPSSTTSPLAQRVAKLQSALEKLEAVSTSFESRMDALEASINNLTASHASVEAAVETLTEAQHTMIEKLTTLTQRVESWATRSTSGSVGRPTPPSDAAAATTTTGPRSRHHKNVR